MKKNRTHFQCPDCQAALKAPFNLVGHSRPCPYCSRAVVIPPAVSDEADPILVFDDDNGRVTC